MNIICNPVVLIYIPFIHLLARNCYYNLKPNFWSHCFNSPELKAQVRYDNKYIDGLLSLSASISKEYISVLIKFNVKHIHVVARGKAAMGNIKLP